VICRLNKNEDKIIRGVRASAPFQRKMYFVSHYDALRALCVWLEDKIQSGLPVSGAVVGEKASGWWNLADITSPWSQKGKKQEPFYNVLKVKYESLETKLLFLDWYSCFVYEIKKYLKSPMIWHSLSSLSSIVPQGICRILGLTNPNMK